MATNEWLTTHSSTNLIPISKRVEPDELSVPATFGGTIQRWERDITTEKYNYVGMTLTAADACIAAIHDPSSGVYAGRNKEGAGGNYMVEVTAITYSVWVLA